MGASMQRATTPSVDGDRAQSEASCSDADAAQPSDGLPADSDLLEALARAEKRAGRLAVQGRYHRLPRRLTDDYDVEGEVLGVGYAGSVRSAVCLRTGAACAVKRLRLRGLDAARKRDLVSEVEVSLTVDHPHVVRLLDVYESDTHLTLVMERLSGGEVMRRLTSQRYFSEQKAAETLRQMLLAVSYLHKEGIVHRDLKLENFMYESEGSDVLKCIDFGFSRFFDRSGREKMRESPGTLAYVAPEVLAKSYRHSSCDMWSLGVVAFVLLCGGMPFDQWDPELRRKIRKGRYSMWQQRWARVSQEATDFVKGLLVVSPRRRMTVEQALLHPWIAKCCAKSAGDATAAEAAFAESCAAFAGATPMQQLGLRMLSWSLPADDRDCWRSAYVDLTQSASGALSMQEVKAVLQRHIATEAACEKAVGAMAALSGDGDGTLRYSDFVAAALASQAAARAAAQAAAQAASEAEADEAADGESVGEERPDAEAAPP